MILIEKIIGDLWHFSNCELPYGFKIESLLGKLVNYLNSYGCIRLEEKTSVDLMAYDEVEMTVVEVFEYNKLGIEMNYPPKGK